MNKTNLELKHYCKDFDKIRIILKMMGARKVIVKNQKDYFFNLPGVNKNKSPRLKMRVEGKKQILIYYERPEFVKGKETPSSVNLFEVKDNNILPFLIKIKFIEVNVIVEKKREKWQKDNIVFHLDNVKGVGKIFEIELQKNGSKITEKDRKIFKSYQDQFLPFLGSVIKGSNADLVLSKKLSK